MLLQLRDVGLIAVPSFVPTTKPYQVLPSVRGGPKSLAGQGVCSTSSHFVSRGVSR
jgi:hypothetical protein